MRITAATIKDFKRIQNVTITPDADRTLILIGGRNAQGKSSLIDALTTAIGGKRAQPTDPVRHGADQAEIHLELDGGDLTIRRTIDGDGQSSLEVRDRLGAMKSPQAVLDKLVGARFLDPISFLSLSARDQRQQLMRMIDGADQIGELNLRRERVFARRTEVNRDLEKATGHLASIAEVEVGTPIDTSALTTEAKQFAEQRSAGDGLGLADGALFDEDSLAAVAEQAAAAGKRVWIERVGTRDPGVIVIADGKVAE